MPAPRLNSPVSPRLLDQVLEIAGLDSGQLPAASRNQARLSFFDWMVCGLGGLNEPVSRNVLAFIRAEHASGPCAVFGGGRASALAAALANGTISHALDYDDTHFDHVGHLSVGIYPAVLAVGQELNASIDDLVDAFLVGAESAIRIGLALGTAHYARGFHQTATAGAFGATVAVSRLLGLSHQQRVAALGLCATRASGLKIQFGTMGKPLNAGFSASNGVECAKLAALGMTSADNGLEGAQGFLETHSDAPSNALDVDRFLFDRIRYKLHACCHGTHAMIEAILATQKQHHIQSEDLKQMTVSVNPRWLRVCDIKQPRTGLEVKFSYAWLAGMAMHGISTENPDTYTDTLCSNESLRSFAGKVVVEGSDSTSDTEARIAFELVSGSKVSNQHDLMSDIDDSLLRRRLFDKASAVIGDRAQPLWDLLFEGGDQSASTLNDLLQSPVAPVRP